MSDAVDNKLLLYADDSAILVVDKNISNKVILLKKELETFSDWLIDNKLSLHLGKTEAMLFRSKIKLESESDLNISCKGTDTEPQESDTYLDATLEQCLSGESVVESIIQKANARLKFVYRTQNVLNLLTKSY